MKLPDNIVSTNIELSCLGKIVPITSPEAGAAEQCLADVDSARQAMGQSSVNSFKKWGILSGSGSEQDARDAGEHQFNDVIKDYVMGQPHGWTANILDSANPESYDDRERDFFQRLNASLR